VLAFCREAAGDRTSRPVTEGARDTKVTLTRLCLLAMLLFMSDSRQKPRKNSRPPRIRVPNDEQALFTVNGRKLLGVLKRLSMTGGSVVLRRGSVAPGTLAEMDLNTIFGQMAAQIEFLQMGADGLPSAQAFRFVGMDQVSRQRFTAAAEQMQRAGFSDVKEERTVLKLAHQSFGKLRDSIRRFSGAANPVLDRTNLRKGKHGSRS